MLLRKIVGRVKRGRYVSVRRMRGPRRNPPPLLSIVGYARMSAKANRNARAALTHPTEYLMQATSEGTLWQ